MIYKFLFCLPFGSLFGCLLGSQIDQKQVPETTSKTDQKSVQKIASKWSQRAPKREPKLSKMTSWISPSSTSAPKWPLRHRFRSPFGSIWGSFLKDFWSETTLQKATVQTTATTEMKRKLQPRQPRPASDRTIENPGWNTTQLYEDSAKTKLHPATIMKTKAVQYGRKLKKTLAHTTPHKTTAETKPQLKHNRREPQQLPHRNIRKLQPRPHYRKP